MRYFAIRHRPSGMLMPQCHRGSTHLDLPWGPRVPPRLFTSERAAELSLTWWLKGKTSNDSYQDWESGYEEIRGLKTTPVTGRKREDMDVVVLAFEVGA